MTARLGITFTDQFSAGANGDSVRVGIVLVGEEYLSGYNVGYATGLDLGLQKGIAIGNARGRDYGYEEGRADTHAIRNKPVTILPAISNDLQKGIGIGRVLGRAEGST